jgi:hypothetical protein
MEPAPLDLRIDRQLGAHLDSERVDFCRLLRAFAVERYDVVRIGDMLSANVDAGASLPQMWVMLSANVWMSVRLW